MQHCHCEHVSFWLKASLCLHHNRSASIAVDICTFFSISPKLRPEPDLYLHRKTIRLNLTATAKFKTHPKILNILYIFASFHLLATDCFCNLSSMCSTLVISFFSSSHWALHILLQHTTNNTQITKNTDCQCWLGMIIHRDIQMSQISYNPEIWRWKKMHLPACSSMK